MSTPHVEHLSKLCEPGILGFPTHCEITEIFAIIDGIADPQNIFTVAVLEQRTAITKPHYLNAGGPIHIKKLEGWRIGLKRTVLEIEVFLQHLDAFVVNSIWTASGDKLATAPLRPINPQFVPADWSSEIPLNRVLKNNFWSGSHIFEWADPEKALFKPFFKKPELLSALSTELIAFAPIDLSAASDRLGNIIVQLPVTAVTGRFSMDHDRNSYELQLGWHPRVTPRPLRALMSSEFDETYTGFVSSEVTHSVTTLPYPDNAGDAKAVLWDDEHDVILTTTGPMHFIDQVRFRMHVVGLADPRIFTFTDRAGNPRTERVGLTGPETESSVGEARKDPNGGFTQNRLYKHATEVALREKRFVLYGTDVQDAEKDHQTALGHLRELIRKHGSYGAWLWDPYLDAVDILETLFYSPHSASDLRALCSAEDPNTNISKPQFIANQQAYLAAITSNFQGLRLEYRAAHTIPNINFHDRFLIFPRPEEGAIAWSLGTSVNQAGKVHHILQQCDDGQRVSDAFEDFWQRLDPSHVVWKQP